MKIISNNNCKEIEEYLKFNKIASCNSDIFIEELKNKKNVVILGNFDGVHNAHQKIINEANIISKILGYNTVIYTFREYPNTKKYRITTTSEKLDLLEKSGVDYVYLDEFENIREYSPEQFIEEILIKKLNAKEIFFGFNYTFGKNKSGNFKVMKQIITKKYSNVNLNCIEPIFDENKEIISSTRIREYIEKRDINQVNNLLGHPFTIIGEVIHGKKLGRTLGFPTANLKFKDKIYPSYGVYGAYVKIEDDDKIYNAVINIGKNPTVEFTGLTVEAHLLDFNEDIYGKIVKIELLESIRSERRMSSVNELVVQINKDIFNWKEKIQEKYNDTNKN